MRGVGMKEVKSNRAWREECEALRCERDDWKVECGHAEALAAKCMAELAAMTAERDMWKETDLRDAKRIDELAEQLAAVMEARNEAVSAVQRLSEGQLFNDVVHADIVRRGMEALAAMTAERDRWKAALAAERESWAQLVDHIYKSDSGTYSDAIRRLT